MYFILTNVPDCKLKDHLHRSTEILVLKLRSVGMNYHLPKLLFFTDPYWAGVSNKHCLLAFFHFAIKLLKLLRKREGELVTLILLCSCHCVVVLCSVVPVCGAWVGLWLEIVASPGHTQLLFYRGWCDTFCRGLVILLSEKINST